tara:strand:- start:213 stop:863 length:651 start_codon:yes stop_codon:yes gene_type:complete
MSNIVESFNKIKLNINKLQKKQEVNIVAISKTFPIQHIKPLIDYGHNHFGENKVQEALSKWSEVKKNNSKIHLHMVGKLQSNKAKDAAKIFDYIHSLDSQKLADILSNCEKNNNKMLKYFIQVNLGNETQKSGLPVNEVEPFFNYCTKEKKLNVIGLMIIPPNDTNTIDYFKNINQLNSSIGLKELSMGMSADYEQAIVYGATFVRLGSVIFGKRS